MNHVANHPISKKPINSITENEAQEFLSAIAMGPDGQRKLVQVIRKCTREAITKGWLGHCPFNKDEIRLKRVDRANRIKAYDPLTEIPRFFAECNEGEEEFYGCLYFGAMRKSDARLLEWQDISFKHNRITFPAHKTKRRNTESIKMIGDLRKLLVRRHERMGNPSTGYVFADARGEKHRGRPYGRNYPFGLEELLEKAGIEKIEQRAYHGFRHGGALAAASGVWGEPWTMEEVDKLLRDKSMKAVQVYFDILDAHMDEKVANATSQLDSIEKVPDTLGYVAAPNSQSVPGRPFPYWATTIGA